MSDQILIRIGKKIREIRQQQRVKLHELAEDAQISKGLLSKIENARTIPSLPVLISVIQALRVDMRSFFEDIEMPHHERFIHRRQSEYTPMEKEEAQGFLYQFILSQNVQNIALEAVILELQPGSHREKVTTDGFEFKYVMEGDVDYHLGDDVVRMEAGDSIFFDGKIPHVPVNRSKSRVVMLVIYLLLPANGK